jgi:uncharacterized membrane protein YeaQ/YmgE (transglycosylase-associated protein family)
VWRTATDDTTGVIALILLWLLSGLFIGALGRLALPGPQPMGCITTALCGLGGSFLGGIAGSVLFAGMWRAHHRPLASLVLAVLGAALLVWLVSGRRRAAY